jgi:hypothetical protein
LDWGRPTGHNCPQKYNLEHLNVGIQYQCVDKRKRGRKVQGEEELQVVVAGNGAAVAGESDGEEGEKKR